MRQTSWYICFHSAIGSTLTSDSGQFERALARLRREWRRARSRNCGTGAAPGCRAAPRRAAARRPCAAASCRRWRRGRTTPRHRRVSRSCASSGRSAISVAPPPPDRRGRRRRRSPGSMHEENAGASRLRARGRRAREAAGRRCAAGSCRNRCAPVSAVSPEPRGARACIAAAAAAPAIRRRTRRAFLIAFRRERRRNVVRQHRQVDAAGDFVLVAAHVEPAGGGPVVGAGREIQILPVAVEHGIAAHRSCHR